MMTRNESQKRMLLKYSLAAPLFLLLVLALAIPHSPLMANTEGVADKIANSVERVDNQSFIKNEKPEIVVKGTDEGWVLPQNLHQVTALEINQGFEIVRFKMYIQKTDGAKPIETFYNTGSTFNKDVLERIRQSKPNDYFHFVDIIIRDLKTNDEYIYGDCYLNIVKKIPAQMVDYQKKGREQRLNDTMKAQTLLPVNFPTKKY